MKNKSSKKPKYDQVKVDEAWVPATEVKGQTGRTVVTFSSSPGEGKKRSKSSKKKDKDKRRNRT